ncbi:MAG TPA: diacylglycerol kinase family protein [Terriglobia bacterium]|nr:diacylglycerol kinase family protein [Terriglobia bacterium]
MQHLVASVGMMPPSTQTSEALVILNTGSGKQQAGALVDRLRAVARAAGKPCSFWVAKGAKGIARAAATANEGRYQRVIAAGGDGTLSAIASALVGTGKEFAAVPLGTFNYFARETGLPLEPDAAFEYALQGKARPVSIGELNGKPFLNNASVGLYPKVLEVREHTYRRFGRSRLAAYWSVLQVLARFNVNFAAELSMADAPPMRIRTPMIFVGRNAHQLEEFRLPGGECVDNDTLAAYVLPAAGRAALLATATRLLMGKTRPGEDVRMFCAQELQVRLAGHRWTAAIDGERVRVSSPLNLRIRRNALLAVVPENH